MAVSFDRRDKANRSYRRDLLAAGLAGDNLARVKYAAFRAAMMMGEKLMLGDVTDVDADAMAARARQVLNRLKRLSSAWNLKHLKKENSDV